ncbi:MAG: aldo/keto reductase [Planctomycetota bacterium]|nr:aldo/keto reductase [Planctomycetota bacterium]
MPLDRKVWGLQDVDLVRQPHLKRETPWDEIWHVAIVWLLRNPIVTSPIIGPRTMEQLTGSLRSLEVKLDAEALAKLDKIFPGPGGEAPEAYAW